MNLIEGEGFYSVSDDIFATIEPDGTLLIRYWSDNLSFEAVWFLARNTDKELDVFPGPTGFWQGAGFKLINKEQNRWRYQR